MDDFFESAVEAVESFELVLLKDIFEPELQDKRLALLELCEQLILDSDPVLGPRARSVLWTNCFYHYINFVKSNQIQLKKMQKTNKKRFLKQLEDLLSEGLKFIKQMGSKLICQHGIDLKYLIDLSLFDHEEHFKDDRRMDFTLKQHNVALRTIYYLLVYMGDISMYCTEFGIHKNLELTRQSIAKYYSEAVKMCPRLGLAHNQLSVIHFGRNRNLSSVYHSIYALLCEFPCADAELNLEKILEGCSMSVYEELNNKKEITVDEFYARFYLVIDTVFIKKLLPEQYARINQYFLYSFRKLLSSFNEINMFRIVSVLIMMLEYLRTNRAEQFDHFVKLVQDICLNLIKECKANLQKFKAMNSFENEAFHSHYMRMFEMFKQSRSKRTQNEPYADTSIYSTSTSQLTLEQAEVGSVGTQAQNTYALGPHVCKKGCRWHKNRRHKISTHSICSSCDSLVSFDDIDSSSDILSIASSTTVSDISTVFDYQSYRHFNTNRRHYYDYNRNNSAESGRNGKYGKRSNRKYVVKREYNRFDPNVIIKFALTDPVMRSAKTLMQYLLLHKDLTLRTDLIDELIEFLNDINLDIFAPGVYFSRSFIKTPNVRTQLYDLLRDRHIIPLSEDFAFMDFGLFRIKQKTINWNLKLQNNISLEEEAILRLNIFHSQGFYISRSLKYNYRYKKDKRMFDKRSVITLPNNVENNERQCYRSIYTKQSDVTEIGEEQACNSDTREKEFTAKDVKQTTLQKIDTNAPQTITEIGANKSSSVPEKNVVTNWRYREPEVATTPRSAATKQQRSQATVKKSITSTETTGTTVSTGATISTGATGSIGAIGTLPREQVSAENSLPQIKTEAHFEERLPNIILTPFIVIEGAAFAEYINLVKHMANTQRAFILVPSVVLQKLNILQAHCPNAENALRWLKSELEICNRYLYSQAQHERLSLKDVATAADLERLKGSDLLHIAEFINFMIYNHSHLVAPHIVTYLTKTSLQEEQRSSKEVSFVKVMQAMHVQFAQIEQYQYRLEEWIATPCSRNH